MDHDEEVEWVRRARQGDRDAFTRLIDLYWDRIHRWLVGLTGRRHTAEDLTQEAFLKAWIALPGLRGDRTFRVWLFRVARNCLLDTERGRRGQLPEPLSTEVETAEPGPLAQVIQEEAQQNLQAALARLPVPQRAAYLLKMQEELSYAQVARILGVSQETARWHVCKARQKLLKEMQAYLDQTPS